MRNYQQCHFYNRNVHFYIIKCLCRGFRLSPAAAVMGVRRFRRDARTWLAALSGIVLVACQGSSDGGSRAETGGTIVIATTSEPDALFPPSALNMEARQATELIYEYLADVGPGMNTIGDSGFVKQVASAWEWSADSMAIRFTLNPLARWHDGEAVTSRDVAFSYSVYTDPRVGSSTSSGLSDIDSVSIAGPAAVVFHFGKRTQHQFLDAAAQMLILPAHLLDTIPRDSLRMAAAAKAPVGSGRYRLAAWKRGASFELRAVEDHYRGRAGPDRLVWTVTPEYQSAVTQLKAGAADVFPTIRRETIPQLGVGGKFNLISLQGMDYVFMQFNLRNPDDLSRSHPIFGETGVRRAITMALDRHAMVTNLFDTLAAVSIGPTVRAYPVTDTALSQISFDRLAAGQLLDSLGWRRGDRGGIRSRNGIRLAFNVLVPVSSESRMRIAVLMQEQLKQAGIDMKIEQMDYSAFSARQAARTFNAALASWHLGSSPGAVRETWTSAAAGKGGLNYGGYSNPRFDAYVDSALGAGSQAVARTYFTRANQIAIDDAPAVWLYEPTTVIAISSRIRTGPMRPNAWWLGIADWRIPAEERISRDAPLPPSTPSGGG